MTLSEVNDCDDECKLESIHSYPSKEGIFNAFRVLKVNENIDGTNAYDLLKFELFGSVCLTKDCKVPMRKFCSKFYNKHQHYLFIIIISLICTDK